MLSFFKIKKNLRNCNTFFLPVYAALIRVSHFSTYIRHKKTRSNMIEQESKLQFQYKKVTL